VQTLDLATIEASFIINSSQEHLLQKMRSAENALPAVGMDEMLEIDRIPGPKALFRQERILFGIRLEHDLVPAIVQTAIAIDHHVIPVSAKLFISVVVFHGNGLVVDFDREREDGLVRDQADDRTELIGPDLPFVAFLYGLAAILIAGDLDDRVAESERDQERQKVEVGGLDLAVGADGRLGIPAGIAHRSLGDERVDEFFGDGLRAIHDDLGVFILESDDAFDGLGEMDRELIAVIESGHGRPPFG